MYTNVSAEFLTALQRPSRHFAARFKDNGTVVDLEVKNIKAHFGSCGAGSLAVGCAFSSYIEVTANRTDILLEGKELFLEIGLLLPDDSYEYVPFGYWTVQKPTKTKDSMSFQAVDRMNGKFNAEYETELTYPATVAAVLSEFTTKTGITVHCSLQTPTVMIAAPIVGTQRNALSIIAATLLGNAWIDRNGEIQITTIGGGTVVEVNYDYVKTQPEMDEEPTVIEGVKVYTVEGQTDTWIERGTGNQVTVSDVYMTDANLDIVKNNVIGLTYGGGTVSFMGNPLLDPSDIIKFRGGIEMEEYMLVTETNANLVSSNGDELAALAYESYEVPCMDIVQDFDGGLLTTVTATGQFEDTENTIAPAPMAAELARQASAISSAQQTADNAVVLANGKNKIFYQDDAPTAGMSVGDMWFDTNGGNAIYEYKSTGWVLRQLGQGSLAANSVTAVEINVATLSAITANIGEVTAGVLKSTDYSYTSGTYTTAGMIIDLTNKVIRMPNTAILSDGSLYSKKGSIGGWTIADTDIRYSSDNASGTEHDFVRLHSGGITAWHINDPIATTTGFDAHTNGIFSINGGYLDVSQRTGTITNGTRILTQGVRLYSTGGGADYSCNLTANNGGFSSDANITAPTFIGSLTGHASLDLPLTGGTLSGNLIAKVESGEAQVVASNGTHRIYMFSHSDGRSGLYGFKADGTGYSIINITNGATTATFYGHATSDLPLTGGTLTGNITIGQTTDTYVRTVAVLNSLGNVSLAVGGDGKHGIFSNTKGDWLLYATKDANSTNSTLYIPRATSISGTITGYDYSGASHVMVGSAADASHRVGYLYHQNPTTVRVYGQAGGSGYTTYTTLTGSSSSDIRLKRNVADTEIADALSVINQIEMRSFDWLPGWRDYDHQPIGMIADQIEKLDSRLVIGGGYDPDGEPNYKVIDDHYLSCYLTKGIQELCAEIENLKERIRRLEAA